MHIKSLLNKDAMRFHFKKWDKKIVFILLFLFSVNLAFGTFHLAESSRVDEALWTFDRIPKFWDNVMNNKLQKTRISDKPGITVALISGAGMFFENPKEYMHMLWQGENPDVGKSRPRHDLEIATPAHIRIEILRLHAE